MHPLQTKKSFIFTRELRLLVIVIGVISSIGAKAFSQQRQESPEVNRQLLTIYEAFLQIPPMPPNAPTESTARAQAYRDYWLLRFKSGYDQTVGLLQEGRLSSGRDFYLAGLIVSRSPSQDDKLIAHSLFTVAALKGERKAYWASAAALDRYLMLTGKPQLFGTIYKPQSGDPVEHRLGVMDGPVTDPLRREFCVPILARQIALQESIRQDGQPSATLEREATTCTIEP